MEFMQVFNDILMNLNQIKNLKEDFNKNGYLAICPLFDKDKITEINKEIDRYIKICVPKMPEHQVYYEDKSDPGSLDDTSLLPSLVVILSFSPSTTIS